MIFQNNICPLCNQPLQLRFTAGVSVYECKTKVSELEYSHYVVEKDPKMEVQHITVFPYSIDTFADTSKSRIYKIINNRWKLILETSIIQAASHDALLNRIQNLLIYI